MLTIFCDVFPPLVDPSAQCYSECTEEHEGVHDQEAGEKLFVESRER